MASPDAVQAPPMPDSYVDFAPAEHQLLPDLTESMPLQATGGLNSTTLQVNFLQHEEAERPAETDNFGQGQLPC